MTESNAYLNIYEKLLSAYGPQSWWPADTPFEVMVGAVLTQNTAWTNVERAMEGLKDLSELAPKGILSLPPGRLEVAIRSSGYYRQKAARLRGLSRWLIDSYGGETSRMAHVPTDALRRELLELKGIGPETADSILLYALNRPVFVVDAYTIRLLSRLGLCNEESKYPNVQALFTDNLEPDADLFNEYHALIVQHAKARCRKREPKCPDCTLSPACEFNFKIQNSNFNERE